jgi:hypothetical protein
LIDLNFWCFKATFNNISAIVMATNFNGGGSWREPPNMGKFTKLGANTRRIGDRLVYPAT